jgi:hypothetical protein
MVFIVNHFTADRVSVYALAGLIKIDTCNLFVLKYSSSTVSSITTTFPSAGAMINPSSRVSLREGILKRNNEE